jgi:hypothetical protein
MNINEGDWLGFQRWVDDLRKKVDGSSSSRLLFRGQGNSTWPLETTLEREGQKSMLLSDYYRLSIGRIGPAVGTRTGFALPQDQPDVMKTFTIADNFFDPNRFPSGDLYPYLLYLRHHGFPSPLLDWSRSPYVAAFFAFRGKNPATGKRSVYAYCERPAGIKGGAVGEPTIRTLGPYVRSHARHFLQQSAYTVCESFDTGRGWYYDSHQEVFDRGRPGQDLLWRFDLASEERDVVLRFLDEFNLNAYSLFDTDEALLETLWLREHVFR